jgi:hypothetical protein
MNYQQDNFSERTKVREVAAIFRSRAFLDTAVDALLTHGFDRADIDFIASRNEVTRRLGIAHIATEDLADVPIAPRRGVLAREDVSVTLVLVSALTASAAGVAIVWHAIDANWGVLHTTLAAIATATIFGGIAALFVATLLRSVGDLEGDLSVYGLILWVRARTPEKEELAEMLLREHGGHAIRVHEIDSRKIRRTFP